MNDTAAWEPEGLQIKRGEKVVIRLSRECRIADVERHEPATNGQHGMVYDTTPSYDGHTYLVRLDRPYLSDGTLHRAGQFARFELERHDAWVRAEIEQLTREPK